MDTVALPPPMPAQLNFPSIGKDAVPSVPVKQNLGQIKEPVKDAEVKIPPQEDRKAKEPTADSRMQAVIRAAQMFKDIYVVSDTTFTIFKDSSGQYVTRFTSLKDGSVTYIPEPDIVRAMNELSAQREALLNIEA